MCSVQCPPLILNALNQLSQHLRLACRAKALIGADREPIKKIVDFLARDFFPQKKLASYAKRLKRP
jgi:hypothetical protein